MTFKLLTERRNCSFLALKRIIQFCAETTCLFDQLRNIQIVLIQLSRRLLVEL